MIAEFLWVVGFRSGTRRYRLIAASANGQPTYGCYAFDHDEPVGHAHGLLVLTVDGDRVSAMTRFVDNSTLPYFGLPRTLPGQPVAKPSCSPTFWPHAATDRSLRMMDSGSTPRLDLDQPLPRFHRPATTYVIAWS